MYKVKIIFMYTDSEGKCTWSHQWVDFDGNGDIEGVLTEYRAKEEKALKDDDMDQKVVYAMIVECCDITDGKYRCGNCECYFDEPVDGIECPYCGSDDFVEGCIDEPEPTKQEKFNGPRLCKS